MPVAAVDTVCRLGGVVAPFIVYLGDQLGRPKLSFAIVGAAAAATALLAGLLPETRGKRQPDTMADLRSMYGGGGAAVHTSTEARAGGDGALQRLLSSLTSSDSWTLKAVRSRGGSSSGSSGSAASFAAALPELAREESELTVIVADRSESKGQLPENL